jgi:hypothetical protein
VEVTPRSSFAAHDRRIVPLVPVPRAAHAAVVPSYQGDSLVWPYTLVTAGLGYAPRCSGARSSTFLPRPERADAMHARRTLHRAFQCSRAASPGGPGARPEDGR